MLKFLVGYSNIWKTNRYLNFKTSEAKKAKRVKSKKRNNSEII